MARVSFAPLTLGAAALLVAFLSACGGQHSFSNTPAGGSYLPPAGGATSAAKTRKASASTPTPSPAPQSSPVLQVTDLDGGAGAASTGTGALPIMNGSRLRVSIADPDITSGAVRAGDSSATLTPAGKGQWTATLRYVDSSNPPTDHGMLEVKMQTPNGPSTFHIPVAELHQ